MFKPYQPQPQTSAFKTISTGYSSTGLGSLGSLPSPVSSGSTSCLPPSWQSASPLASASVTPSWPTASPVASTGAVM